MGNELWLNAGACIRVMLNSSMLHSPASGAIRMGQSGVYDHGLPHAWLFPLHIMGIPQKLTSQALTCSENPDFFL